MRKLKEGLWRYKGIEITKDYTGNYCSKQFYVKGYDFPVQINAKTQREFIRDFNKFINENGGLC